jgi:hypothetical protein
MNLEIFDYTFVLESDWPILGIAVLFLFLLIFGVSYLIHYKNVVKVIKNFKSGKSNIRFYTIYYNENKVYVVDKHIMKDKRYITLEEFYHSISEEEYVKVKMWLTELIYKDKSMQDSLDVTVKLKNEKNPIFGVLTCTSIDYNTKIAHVECKLFPEYKKNYQPSPALDKIVELNDSQLQDYLETSQRGLTAMYVIRLYSEDSRGHPSTFRARTILMRLIISNLQKFLTDNKRIALTSNNELLILDPTSGYKNDIIAFCHIIIEDIEKVLFQSSVQNDYKFIIGICFDRSKKYNYQDLYKYAKEVSIYGQKRGTEPFLFYDETQDYTKDTYQETLSALKSTIDNKAISVRYTTIYNILAKTEGYTCEFLPDNTVLPSISEIFDIADENKLNLELYSLLYEKVNSAYTIKYFPTKEKRRFIIRFKLKNYKTILNVVNIYPVPNNVKTIFTVTNDDLSEIASNNSKLLKDALKALKADDRIRLGLQFKTTSIDISDNLLEYFDYFIFDQKDDFPDLLKKAQNQILMQNLISTLKEHPLGKLTGINLENFDNIEYFINLGFRYVASPYFGSLVNGLPSNNIKKLSRMTALSKTKKGSN